MMKKDRTKSLLNFVFTSYKVLGVLIILSGLVILLFPTFLSIYAKLNSDAIFQEVNSLTNNVDSDSKTFESLTTKYSQVKNNKLPPFDSSLPEYNRISIQKIGVNTQIEEGVDGLKALEFGPWIVNNFGKPNKNNAPIIIASHRWGGINWTSQDRVLKSFYRLPELKNRDRIKIVWEQREYEYEIYSTSVGEKIVDYDADLILYTCKVLYKSPIRIFKYARLVENNL